MWNESAGTTVWGQSAYDLAARETAKLSSSIWKRVIAPLETVRGEFGWETGIRTLSGMQVFGFSGNSL
jgi:hypothetical protein